MADSHSQTQSAQGSKLKRRPRGSGMVIAGVPRVNLLPASEIQRRAAGALVQRWAVGLLATAVAVAGLVAAAHWERGIAARQLAAEQARTLALNGELAGLAHVSQAFTERTALTSLRAEAVGNDLAWRALFSDLTSVIPRGAELIGFDLITGANPWVDGDPAAAIGVVGRLTIRSKDPADQNRMIDRLRALDITLAADAGSLSSDRAEGFTFIVELVLNQTHYTGKHLVEEGTR